MQEAIEQVRALALGENGFNQKRGSMLSDRASFVGCLQATQQGRLQVRSLSMIRCVICSCAGLQLTQGELPGRATETFFYDTGEWLAVSECLLS